MLVQRRASRSQRNVPDFQDIPGAPTRINSATIVPATATQPEYCDVRGYVQSQVKFQLKLPDLDVAGSLSAVRLRRLLRHDLADDVPRLPHGARRRLRDRLDQRRPRRRRHRRAVGGPDRAAADRLRLSRRARRRRGGEGDPGRLLRPRADQVLLPGLLRRRPRGVDGGAALPGRLRRHHRRRAGATRCSSRRSSSPRRSRPTPAPDGNADPERGQARAAARRGGRRRATATTA